MVAEGIVCGFLAAIGCFVTIWIVLFFAWIRNFCRGKPLPQNDIFNISSRVQGQENNWNPSDLAHVSISQMNKPPQYDEAPPSYDEAMRLASMMSGESSTSGNFQIQTVPRNVPDLTQNVPDLTPNVSATNENVSATNQNVPVPDSTQIVSVSNENVPTSVVVEEPKPTTSTGSN